LDIVGKGWYVTVAVTVFVTVFTHDEDVDRDGVGVEEGGQEVDG